MGAYKAPRPDGFSPCLFQKFWHILGEKVMEFVQNMFQKGTVISDLNDALIFLIPKGEALESLS